MLATFIVYAFMVLVFLGILTTIAQTGQPRKPITPGTSAIVTFFGVIEILALAYLAVQV